PEVAGADGLLDVLERRRVERLDEELLRLRRAHRGELLDRRRRAVVLDPEGVEQGRRRPAGAEALQFVAENVQGLLHAVAAVFQNLFVGHGCSLKSWDPQVPWVLGTR